MSNKETRNLTPTEAMRHNALEAGRLAISVYSNSCALRDVALRLGEISPKDFADEREAIFGTLMALADSLEFRYQQWEERGIEAHEIPEGFGEGVGMQAPKRRSPRTAGGGSRAINRINEGVHHSPIDDLLQNRPPSGGTAIASRPTRANEEYSPTMTIEKVTLAEGCVKLSGRLLCHPAGP